MRTLADDDTLQLPILAHPAFLGSFVTSPDNGISHHALFGQIMRLAGADAVIFPHSGGRFGFSPEECREVADGTQAPLGALRSIFPAPGGGMSLQRIPELLEFYGNEVIFLVGGDLLRNSAEIEKNCERYRKMVDNA
jgi:ribulose-bisphosphate carboxylase large chain